MENIFTAFLLTLMAGLSTGIGSLIALVIRRTDKRVLSASLGFSAGVMIYVAMGEILGEARELLAGELGARPGGFMTLAGFFGGMVVIGLIDRLIPSGENPHEVKSVEEGCEEERGRQIRGGRGKEGGEVKIMEGTEIERGIIEGAEREGKGVQEGKENGGLIRLGLFTALALGLHNLPEGLATFVSALNEPALALPIVLAIAMHNIPEGIAVSVPMYHATGSRWKAFGYSLLSGLAEPVGALVGWLILMPFMTPVVFGMIFAAVAGIMVFISLDELLPAAREYGEHHLSIYALMVGMGVMGLSLLVFG